MSAFRRLRGALAVSIPAALIGVAVVAVPALVLGPRGLPRYQALAEEARVLHERNERLHRRVGSLGREVDWLRDDPEAIERAAREELGMLLPGEFVFQFPRAIPPRTRSGGR